MDNLDQYFSMFLPLIEGELKTIIQTSESESSTFSTMMQYHMGWVSPDGEPEESEHGKRIRPMICLLSAEAIGGSADSALPAAIALELVHNFSLLHDDIEDSSTTRRGRPTVWTIWGEKQAINAGDAMFSLANMAIPKNGQEILTDEQIVNLSLVLSRTCLKLTRGQYLDMSFEDSNTVTPAEYLEMIAGKTASMLSASFQMGAIAASAPGDRIDLFREAGQSLGMAFQIQDDILDIWGDPELTGKEYAIDIKQKKKTYPVILGLCRNLDLMELYQQESAFSDDQVARIIELLDKNDAKIDSETLINEYIQQTREALGIALPENDASSAIFELIEKMLNRQK